MAAARARLAAQPDDPEALSALGEALTLEADGTVTPPAVEAFNKALANQPDDPRALYYLGLHEAQSGDSRAALARWRALLAKSPTDAPFLPMLRAEIERVAKAAGVDPGLPAPAPATGMPQPSREQQDAMAAMTPEQRQQAIRGMVEGLAAKLKETPQDRAGWLRLANAWKVLGENAKAADAYAKADALGPVDARILADWAETHVRALAPGAPPSPQAVAVLERLEKADPKQRAGAVLSRRRLLRRRRQAGRRAALEDAARAAAARRADPRDAAAAHQGSGGEVKNLTPRSAAKRRVSKGGQQHDWLPSFETPLRGSSG